MGKNTLSSPPGQMVDVGGFKLHALLRGQGSPAVVFESGLGGYALQYAHILPQVSAFTTALVYDRAGQAWSEHSPNPRTPENISDELWRLLSKLDISPPYIFVGHSFGGLLVRFFAAFHPDEVAGLVLVDSSDVDQYQAFPDVNRLVGQAALGVRLIKFAARLGLAKALTRVSMGSAARALSKEDLETWLAVASQAGHQDTMLAEFSQHRRYFGPQSDVPSSFGDLPVAILTAGSSVSGKTKFGNMTIDELNAKHQAWQKDLLRLSSRSEHITLTGATHLSILTQAEYAGQIAGAIHRMAGI